MSLAIADPGFRRALNDWQAVAAAELRSVSRLARTWVFVGLGLGVMGTAYGYYSYLHSSVSTGFLSAGDILPRFATAYFKSYVLWFFMAAIVFLAFDLRRRDERERISEVLDSRAVSNIPVIGGRLCAIVLVVLAALVGSVLLIQAIGVVGHALGWRVDSLEPVATYTFLVVDAIPALVLWCAIVCFLAVGLRNRLATAVAALALLGLHMWSFALTPAYLLPAVSLIHIPDNLASDLAPRFATAGNYLHRVSLLLVAGALVVWAAAMHERSDGRPSGKRLLIGTLLAALGAVGMGAVVLRCVEDVRVREAWLASHQDISSERWATVEHIRGDVVIDPGATLELDLEMRLAVPADLTALMFSFNPGLAVTQVRLGDTEAPFVHNDGLLVVEPLQGFPQETKITLALAASGIPDPDFAYLDSAVDWRHESSRNGILWLGTASGIFEKPYVALMPALRWLPHPGPNLEGASPGHLPTVDLTVEVPDGWLVAGPGRRHPQDDGRYRFRPAAAVPEIGLFASRFERHAIAVAGVELELLLHPEHQRGLSHFADAGDLIESRLQTIFGEAAEMGIPYPYDGFSVVEVPTYLRIYGGGARLDTGMALPGMLLLREHGFPYTDVKRLDTLPAGRLAGAAEAFKVQWLETLFTRSPDPGSAARALSRNLLGFQVAADGPGAEALDYICEELGVELFNTTSSRLISPTIYTAHLFAADASFGSTVTQMFRGLRGQFQDANRRGFVVGQYQQPSMWERAAATSLVELDFESNPGQAIRAFGLRARAAAFSIFDGMGRRRTAAFLAELRRRHAGGTFDAADFNAAASAIGVDLPGLIGDWLNEAALPGFMASRARAVRMADDEQGRPRYQTTLQVRNGEPVAGLVRLSHGRFSRSSSDPIRIPGNTAVEVGMVTPRPPEELRLEPYLALNRLPVRIGLAEAEASEDAVREPLVGSRPSAWAPAVEGIVIDDLDPGFSVQDRAGDTNRRMGAAIYGVGRERELDQGLPVASRRAGEWSRATMATAWGKYRHTVAGSIPGDGAAVAIFAADLPEPGRWRLEYHVPDPHGLGFWGPSYGTLGTLAMTVIADGREVAVAYDGASADVGWNEIDEFEFTTTAVRLEISSKTDGEMVIADAIRWVPLD